MSLVASTAPGSLRALGTVEKLVLEDQDGVVIAHGRLEDALGVICVRDGHNLDSGHAREVALHALGVLRAATGRTDRRTHDKRNLDRAARHVAHLGGIVDDLIHGQEEKIAVLNVDDRSHSHHGGANGRAEEAQLGDRRIEDAIGKLLFQAECDRERTPQPPGTPMSSPRQNTDGSRRISSAMPSRSDSAIVCCFINRPQRLSWVFRLVVNHAKTSVVRSASVGNGWRRASSTAVSKPR